MFVAFQYLSSICFVVIRYHYSNPDVGDIDRKERKKEIHTYLEPPVNQATCQNTRTYISRKSGITIHFTNQDTGSET